MGNLFLPLKLFLIPSFVSLHFKFTSYHHVCSKSTPYSGLWPPCWLAEQDCSYRGRWRSSQAFAEEPRRYRCYSMPPNSIHQGRKGRVQRHSCGRYASRRIQITHERSKIVPALVEDIAVGSVLPPGGGATEFRAAALAAGFPVSAAVKSLNRQCSSGLQACVDIANAISSGMIEVGVGAGVESMSLQYGPGAVTEFSELLESHPESANCKVPMGVLSEQMAKDRGVSRKVQDAFAANSY